MSKGAEALELVLLADGGAEVLEGESVIWSSRDDDEFPEEFPELLDENDLEGLLDYLVEQGYLSEAEADEAICSSENLTAGHAANAEYLSADEPDDAEGYPVNP